LGRLQTNAKRHASEEEHNELFHSAYLSPIAFIQTRERFDYMPFFRLSFQCLLEKDFLYNQRMKKDSRVGDPAPSKFCTMSTPTPVPVQSVHRPTN
jgi:hypothetical protein